MLLESTNFHAQVMVQAFKMAVDGRIILELLKKSIHQTRSTTLLKVEFQLEAKSLDLGLRGKESFISY